PKPLAATGLTAPMQSCYKPPKAPTLATTITQSPRIMSGSMTPDRHKVRVLLVDDHEMVVESFRRLLSTTPDIEVVGVAGSAASAVASAVEQHPDVVVIDYRLPDIVGGTART